MDGERGKLLANVRRAAGGAGDDLLIAADELIEMGFALHAGVLVDRHRQTV